MTEIAIEVRNLNKAFKLPTEKHSSLKQAVLDWHKRGYQDLQALKNVNFEVHNGEFFGVVGRNGSGKSTLLKILAGIYIPTSGHVHVEGKLTPFIELGVGFNAELTGRDNVFLNGAILGISHNEMEKRYNEIVDFAELQPFMDQKLKNYSSGMQVRLAFSVAIQAHSDILLIDEVLAVGDQNFQQKCYEVFRDIKNKHKTVIFVSHDLNSIQDFCDRVAVIEAGTIHALDIPSHALTVYSNILRRTLRKDVARQSAGVVKIKSVSILHKDGRSAEVIKEGADFIIKVEITASKTVIRPVIGLAIVNKQGLSVMGPNTAESGYYIDRIQRNQKLSITAQFFNNVLAKGEYLVTAACFDESLTQPYDYWQGATTLKISGKERHGALRLEPRWKTEN